MVIITRPRGVIFSLVLIVSALIKSREESDIRVVQAALGLFGDDEEEPVNCRMAMEDFALAIVFFFRRGSVFILRRSRCVDAVVAVEYPRMMGLIEERDGVC